MWITGKMKGIKVRIDLTSLYSPDCYLPAYFKRMAHGKRFTSYEIEAGTEKNDEGLDKSLYKKRIKTPEKLQTESKLFLVPLNID